MVTNIKDAREALEYIIMEYASDYDRYIRYVVWEDVEKAMADFEASVRADQIEKDAVVADDNWGRGEAAPAILAQLNGENDV